MRTRIERSKRSFLELLVDKGLLSHEQTESLTEAVEGVSASEIRDILLERDLIPEEELYAAWADYLELPYIDLRLTTFDPEALAVISSEIARRDVLIPFGLYSGELAVALDDLNINAVDQLKRRTSYDILVHIATRSRILEAIQIQYGTIDIQTAVDKIDLSQYNAQVLEDAEIAEEVAEAGPIVDVSNGVIMNALKNRASDIHIEPRENYLQIRFRIDGLMQEQYRLDRGIIRPLISRYKIMAGLDIAERRVPQDGRVQYTVDKSQIDIRMSVIPTISGEKVVMRILDKSGMNLEMDQMSFSRQIHLRIERLVSSPHGMFFVTGPTGSGKTTTLYAILRYLNSVERNIVTIEDPVEYRLPLINQVQVNSDIGLDFPRVLRSVLRQDPDVILIGEIRDLETAKIAAEAALTGHLVFSTLHTNNAIEAILRLVEIGVESFMVAPSLIGISAQRLVRRICPKCKEEYVASAEETSYLGLSTADPMVKLYRGGGCSACARTGYSGRLAIHELAVVTDEMRELIFQKAATDRIARVAYEAGYRSMRFDGLKKALRGLTTLSEVLRVTTAQEDFLVD